MLAENIEGWMMLEELDWLAQQARHCQVIVELGTWKGRSAAAFAEHCPGTVFCVDHFQGSASELDTAHREAAENSEIVRDQCLSNLHPWIAQGRLFVLDADLHQAFAVLSPLLRHRPADLVFIDASHDEQDVLHNITGSRSLLRSGGMLCGHDRNWPGVDAALRQLLPDFQCGPGSLWFSHASF